MELDRLAVDSQIEILARELAKRDGRGGGRATAIIGAGFSRNADRQSGSRRKFPLWRDIVRPLIDELVPPCPRCPLEGSCPVDAHPGCKLALRRRYLFDDAAGASGMMALGDKFEAQRGKARLRAALKTAIPDEEYVPGKAHQFLVRLPWADIFTTNWDTLLERAVDAYDRSYDTVVTVEQIASTSSPRIVKLHGCVRAGTSLIFTEEDFRTYPATYAPFVSLVQQSLTENVVVLFGFSGADPNFRAWHGWVRDHLGRHTQPLYMVTLKPADAVDVHLMSNRLITPIDLSSKWPNVDDNVKVEQFLFELNRRLRTLKENLDWPTSRRHALDGDPSAASATYLKDWQRRIETFPGWLVAPARNRSDLLTSLDLAVSSVLTPVQSISAAMNAFVALSHAPPERRNRSDVYAFLNERDKTASVIAESLRIALARPGDLLYVRLRRILADVLIDLMKSSTSDETGLPDTNLILQRLKTVVDLEGQSSDLPDSSGGFAEATDFDNLTRSAESLEPAERGLRHGVVRELIALGEIVEREARLRSQHNIARVLRAALWVATTYEPSRELAVRGAIAAALIRLDLADVDALLAIWPDQPHDAASNLRHAAVRREMGRFADAEKEIESIVNRLRALGSGRRRNTSEASKEAWAFFLYADLLEANEKVLRAIVERRHKNLILEEVITELHERLDELETRGRDPRREIDRLARDMQQATEQARLARKASVGAKFTFRHVVADPASAFTIFSETVGLALNLAFGSSRLALSAARLLAPTHRELAIGLLLRAGTPEDLPFETTKAEDTSNFEDVEWLVSEIVFDKQQTRTDLQALCTILGSLAAPTAAAFDREYLDRKIRLLQHLIAGLTARGPTLDSLEAVFDLACRVAHSSVVIANGAGWSNQSMLFHRSLEGLLNGPSDLLSVLTMLLGLPLPTDADEPRAAGWPDPFKLLVRVPDLEANTPSLPRRFKLRPLGQRLVLRASEELRRDNSLAPFFDEQRKSLNALALGFRIERRKFVLRRLEVLNSVMELLKQPTGRTEPKQSKKPLDKSRRRR